jgi:trehalose-6-phosphate synthase
MKKSELVRMMIAQAKSNGLTAEDVITAVMADIGFQRQLARAYVNNNWDKVTVVAKVKKALSMSKDAIRKREARAKAKALA